MAVTKKQAAGSVIGGVAVAALVVWQTGYTGANEGLRLAAYRDSTGVPTICVGHTGPDVQMGMTWTKAQCDAVFAADLHDKVDVPLSACVKPPKPLGPSLVVALRDFTFNVGPGAACSSTLIRLINEGRTAEACDQFPRWAYARGILLRGLAIRRASERQLCLQSLKEVQ
jgi:lysozyme